MTLGYDFHLHSCLSPCGSTDMTPFNLVNMAKILGLDLIALTDHNTAANCRAAMEVGRGAELTVIPGMELCTSEEIHVVCLFADLEAAEAFSDYVHTTLPPVQNNPAVFGDQLILDHQDRIIGQEELLLVTASAISIDAVPGLVRGYGGFCYPAHIDRASFSILASFGMLTLEMGFTCAEVTQGGDLAALTALHPDLASMRIMRSSDAHYLENMREAADFLHLPENTSEAALNYLQNFTPR